MEPFYSFSPLVYEKTLWEYFSIETKITTSAEASNRVLLWATGDICKIRPIR